MLTRATVGNAGTRSEENLAEGGQEILQVRLRDPEMVPIYQARHQGRKIEMAEDIP